jgi:threonine/homoserine efflux transporter RhtA
VTTLPAYRREPGGAAGPAGWFRFRLPAVAAYARTASDSVPPPALIVAGIVSLQLGSALAKSLFTQLPVATVVGMRVITAAVLLCALWRPDPRRLNRGDVLVVAGFGVTAALMSLAFYGAIARLPLGVAVTIEFLGPLGVAIASSRRWRDLLWVALAGSGVVLLSRDGLHGGGLDVVGIVFALLAAAGWATYIILTRVNGSRFADGSGLAMSMVVASAVVLPFGLHGAAGHLDPGHLDPGLLALGAGVGLLSTVIPFSLELEALRRIPPGLFGLFMSIEPAIAALSGWVVLGEGLDLASWAAIACVAVACAGATRGQPSH